MKNIIEKILTFTELEYDWDGYGAIPLCIDVYENSKIILNYLNTDVDDVFPNPHGTLGIEYVNEDKFLYIEVGEKSMTWYSKSYKKDFVEINDESLKELKNILKYENII